MKHVFIFELLFFFTRCTRDARDKERKQKEKRFSSRSRHSTCSYNFYFIRNFILISTGSFFQFQFNLILIKLSIQFNAILIIFYLLRWKRICDHIVRTNIRANIIRTNVELQRNVLTICLNSYTRHEKNPFNWKCEISTCGSRRFIKWQRNYSSSGEEPSCTRRKIS